MTKFKVSLLSTLSSLLLCSAVFFAASYAFAKATPWPAFVIVDDLKIEKNKSEVANMPKVYDQGVFNICHAMAAKTLLEWYTCKRNGIANCAAVPQDQEVSALSVLGYARPNTAACTETNGTYFAHGLQIPANYCGKELPGSIPNSYTNIGLFSGNILPVMLNSSHMRRFKAEACSPFAQLDKAVSANGGTDESFNRSIEQLYRLHKGKSEDCDSCLASLTDVIHRLVGSNVLTKEGTKQALSANSQQKFLYRILMRDCPDLDRSNDRTFVGFFPEKNLPEPERPKNINDVFTKIRSLVKNGTPVALSNICLSSVDATGRCDGGTHVVVVSGYKTVCSNGETRCKQLLKIRNSWGQKWHDDYGEWFDQEALIASIELTKPPQIGTVLSWYESYE